jgi:hypothetical protein
MGCVVRVVGRLQAARRIRLFASWLFVSEGDQRQRTL